LQYLFALFLFFLLILLSSQAFDIITSILAVCLFYRPFNITKMKKAYITTSIAYVNSSPHIGHALEVVQTDALARFL